MNQNGTCDIKLPSSRDFKTETRSLPPLSYFDLIARSFSIPSTECKAESGEPDSTTVKQSSVMTNSRRTVLPVEKMPPAAELEEFFAAAQKDLHKRFRDK